MKAIAKAILNVMKDVKGIEKSMTVGSGNFSYKGVSDYEIKKLLKPIMEKHGLVILPINVSAETKVSRWEEENNWNGKITLKQKQSVFTEVSTKYLLLHSSGESIELAGYGQGVDTQDKSAGKATTYALKYTLLYAFLIPTGKIDDADNHHSEEQPTPVRTVKPKKKVVTEEIFKKAIVTDKVSTVKTLLDTYQMTDAQRKVLQGHYDKISASDYKPKEAGK